MQRTPSAPDGPETPEVLERFSAWARHTVDHIHDSRGLSVRAIARDAGVARSIIYRWIDGEITKAPEQETVKRFCDNLGVPRDEPYAILGWSTGSAPASHQFKVSDPDLVAIQEILDKHGATSDDDVFMIRSILRSLRERYSTDDSGDDRAAG